MTGTVAAWQALAKHGIIHSEDGRQIRFSGDQVWPYDLAKVDRGQIVHFDLEEGSRSTARNVRCWMPEPLISALKTSPTTGHLQYEGFDHKANLREYHFRRLVSGQPAEYFVVCADIALLAKHGITLQEGPAICECRLASALQSPCRDCHTPFRYVLTADDLREHVAKSRSAVAIAGKKKFRRHAVGSAAVHAS